MDPQLILFERVMAVLLEFTNKIAGNEKCLHSHYFLAKGVEIPPELTNHQIMFSYAWADAANNSTIFVKDVLVWRNLRKLMGLMYKHLQNAGVSVWYDLACMIGDVEARMRDGVDSSTVILLMGTETYKHKTDPNQTTNVKKELDFVLAKHDKTVVPIVIESNYDHIFKDKLSLSKIVVDFAKFLNMNESSALGDDNAYPFIKDIRGYVVAFARQADPPGILPIALGLDKVSNHADFRKAFKESYASAYDLLMRQIDEIYAKTSSSSSSLPAMFNHLPCIPSDELEYDTREDQIGQGRFGRVYEGKWKRDGGWMPVAIKEIQGPLTADSFNDFKKEAEAMLRGNNANVVRLYGVMIHKLPKPPAPQIPKVAALVCELMKGGTLSSLLMDDQRQLSLDDKMKIANDLAHGLYMLHGVGIIHRDIKSGNVLLDESMNAKWSDFGLAKVKDASTRGSTMRRDLVGTDAYISPELFVDVSMIQNVSAGVHVPYSFASDIYAFGLVLWELAARRQPYAAVPVSSIRDLVKSGKREEIPASTPPFLRSIIEACWQQRPSDRPDLLAVMFKLKHREPMITAVEISASPRTATPVALPPASPSIPNPPANPSIPIPPSFATSDNSSLNSLPGNFGRMTIQSPSNTAPQPHPPPIPKSARRTFTSNSWNDYQHDHKGKEHSLAGYYASEYYKGNQK